MKYTVIYVTRIDTYSDVTKTGFERIELNLNETLEQALNRLNLTDFMVFIFEGWPKLEGEI